MSVLIDTSIWSLCLRRRHGRSADEEALVVELEQLIGAGQARIIGVVRQELLTGIRRSEQFDELRDQLRSYGDLPLSVIDHESAAQHANACAARGIQSSTVDMLICAIAIRHELAIFTTDPDFTAYRKHIPIRLHRAT